MSDSNKETALIVFLLVCAVLIGCALGTKISYASWEQKAIENNAAYYHPDTGAFTWGQP